MQKSYPYQSDLEQTNALGGSLSTACSKDATRLCKLAANLVEAHTASIFIPEGQKLLPVAWQTMAPQAVTFNPLALDHGLIGWVAKNKKPIHVSPFERDSRILGMYREDLQLKSCLGTPIMIPDQSQVAGVLMVDSKKAFAFSKIQGKLLEDIAAEATALLTLHQALSKNKETKGDYVQFLNQAHHLVQMIGIDSIAVLRMRASNFSQIENELGLFQTTQAFESLSRLIQQALPPKYPMHVTPQGEILCVVDSMMVDSFTNKFLVISEHPSLRSRSGLGFSLEFRARTCARGERLSSIEPLIQQTIFASMTAPMASDNSSQIVTEEPRRRLFAFR
jgi:GAF domain-containing protein